VSNTSKIKHIDIAFHHVVDEVDQGRIGVYWVRGENMLADGMTNSLSREAFERNRRRIGIGPVWPGQALVRRENYAWAPGEQGSKARDSFIFAGLGEFRRLESFRGVSECGDLVCAGKTLQAYISVLQVASMKNISSIPTIPTSLCSWNWCSKISGRRPTELLLRCIFNKSTQKNI
jgi:hypothetical protein